MWVCFDTPAYNQCPFPLGLGWPLALYLSPIPNSIRPFIQLSWENCDSPSYPIHCHLLS